MAAISRQPAPSSVRTRRSGSRCVKKSTTMLAPRS
jgi:hypothetical protein